MRRLKRDWLGEEARAADDDRHLLLLLLRLLQEINRLKVSFFSMGFFVGGSEGSFSNAPGNRYFSFFLFPEVEIE